MAEPTKRGKTVLRSVDGGKGAGVCTFSISKAGIEASVSAQLFSGGMASAVLQFGPGQAYRCRPGVSLNEPLRCAEPGVMAMWVLEDGKPRLFGQLTPGVFDREAARRALPGSESVEPKDIMVKAASLPETSPELESKPEDAEIPFRALFNQAGEDSPLRLLKPSEPGEDAAPPPEPDSTIEKREPESPAQPETIAEQENTQAQKPAAKQQPWSPLIVKRAPRPAPRTNVYTPLWDDISVELDKMLDTLPQAHPFNGAEAGARFAEVPLDGAVQCYVGSVEINGLKVFLQAVPARPYARPAGFDHSLVARNGECYWVKYSIQNE